MYRYYAFELSIRSELSFPELLPYSTSTTSDQDQVAIKFGEVNHNGLAGSNQSSSLSSPLYQVTESAFWLQVPDVARFLVTDGNQIIIDPVAGIDQDSIRLFLLGSCMGALLMQRDLFLLHGNAIKVGKHCISVVGHSGAGKSTLSAAFFKRGYSILADDVCAVNPMHQVIPSFPQIKLWLDAANHLDIATQTLRKIRPCAEKFAVPLGQQFYRGSLPLKLVYVLNSHSRDEISFTNLSGVQKLQSLRNNTYRINYLKGLARHHLHFEQCAQIANQIMVVHINRPDTGFKLNELVTLIESDLIERGLHSLKQPDVY